MRGTGAEGGGCGGIAPGEGAEALGKKGRLFVEPAIYVLDMAWRRNRITGMGLKEGGGNPRGRVHLNSAFSHFPWAARLGECERDK